MSRIRFQQLATAPDTPAAGTAVLYVMDDGHVYIKDDTGTATQIDGFGGTVADDIEITDATKGIILRNSGGTRFRVTVNDNNELVHTELA